MRKNGLILFIITAIFVFIFILGSNINKKLINKEDKTSNKVANSKETKIIKTESKNYISYLVENQERDLTYTWSFKKTKDFNDKVNNLIENLSLRLMIDATTESTKEINELVNQDKTIVSFDYHGTLPEKAVVKINVSDKFKDGDKLYLYYYNEDKSQIEFIDDNIIVNDGYAEFSIDHCSDYFLTAAVVNDVAKNPKSINYIIIGLGLVVFGLVAYTLAQSKK